VGKNVEIAEVQTIFNSTYKSMDRLMLQAAIQHRHTWCNWPRLAVQPKQPRQCSAQPVWPSTSHWCKENKIEAANIRPMFWLLHS